MADQTLSALTAAANVTGADFYGVQGGVSKKFAASLFSAVFAGLGSANAFTAAQSIAPAQLTGADASAALAVAASWNTTGAPSAIDLNVAQTAVGNAASFLVMRKGATRYVDIRAADAYSGVGTATQGGPRIVLGTNAPSNDDSALLICRNVIGQNLFSHAIRDESVFDGMNGGGTDAAYASFDGAASYSNSPNHFHTFQARPTKTGASTVGQYASFIHTPVASGGTVTNLYGLLVKDTTGAGAVTTQYGIYIEPLSKATNNNAIFVAGNNPVYFGGTLQVAGLSTLQGGVTMQYSNNAFARSVSIRNVNAGTQAITAFTLNDATGARGGIDYFPANYANPGIANYVQLNSFGTSPLGIVSAADQAAGSGTRLFFKVGGADTDVLSFAASTGVATFGRKVNLIAGATGGAPLNIPAGSAPASPVNGDIWTETSDLKIRLNGTTFTITKT